MNILSSGSDQLPDLIAVTGRADSCLILGGTNLTEYMLDQAVKCEELQELLTGLYRAQIIYEDNKQYLEFDLEIQQEVSLNAAILDRIYYSLMKSLGQSESNFLNKWRNIYSAWDDAPNKRILRLNLMPWPALSQATETSIKQRGIVK